MYYSLNKETLFANSKGKTKEIGFFMPTASKKERIMIIKSCELYDTISDFLIGYDETKSVKKSIYDSLKDIIEKKDDYKYYWEKTSEGELINEHGNVIFIFTDSNSIFARELTHVPEIYHAAQSLYTSLSQVQRNKHKSVYKEVNKVYARIIDNNY